MEAKGEVMVSLKLDRVCLEDDVPTPSRKVVYEIFFPIYSTHPRAPEAKNTLEILI
jgi:hypothetical protein